MNDRRGFSIIELIAVLIVLSVLILLVAPSILSTSEGSKKKLKEAKIETITFAAGNFVEDNIDYFSTCNSNTSDKDITDRCIIPIDTLVEKNYVDYDNKSNDGILDPVTDKNLNGSVLVCYNMKNGLFMTKYYESDVIASIINDGNLCSGTDVHTLSLKDSSILINWNEGLTDYSNPIFSTGEYIGSFKLEIDSSFYNYGDIKVNGSQLDISFNAQVEVLDNPLTFPVSIKGEYYVKDAEGNYAKDAGGNNITEEISTNFHITVSDKLTSDAATLAVTIKPTALFKSVLEKHFSTNKFKDGFVLTCAQNNANGCEIDINEIYNYTQITADELKAVGYTFITNYSLDIPVEQYYHHGAGQNGTNNGSGKVTYRICKDDACKDLNLSTPKLNDGSIFYVGLIPNTVLVTLNTNGGTISETNTATTKNKTVVYTEQYGKKISDTDGVLSLAKSSLLKPYRRGHTFLGWYTDVANGSQVTDTSTVNTFNRHTLYAHWQVNKYNYKVIHTLMDLNGKYTIVDSTQTLSADFGTEVTADVKKFTGFTSPDKISIVIDVDEEDPISNIIDYKYKRNKYTLTKKFNNGSDDTSKELYFEETTDLGNPTKEGHTFVNWSVTAGELSGTKLKMEAKDATATANWTPNIYKYVVNHYLQNVAGTGYVLESTETISATFGTEVSPSTNKYDGFTAPSKTTIKIKVDGDTPKVNVVNYYYTRNKYDLTVNPNGGKYNKSTSSSTYEMYYQATKEISDPTRTGYTFNNWKVSAGTLKDKVFTMGLIDSTLTAQWTINTYTITLNISGATESQKILKVDYNNTGTHTVTPDATHKLAGATISCTNSLSASINTTSGKITVSNVANDSTCTVTLPIAYTCATGTLTNDVKKGVVCVTDAWTTSESYDCNCEDYDCNCVEEKYNCKGYDCNCVDVSCNCEKGPCNCEDKPCNCEDISCNCETYTYGCETYECNCVTLEYDPTYNLCIEDCMSTCTETENLSCSTGCANICGNKPTQQCETCTKNCKTGYKNCETCTKCDTCTYCDECDYCDTCQECETCQTCDTREVCETCTECDTCYRTVYYCATNWSIYSGSEESLTCYKAATAT